MLENGPSSFYATFFDIDWHPVKAELDDKVLLPILGDQYGVVLEKGELKLAFEPERGRSSSATGTTGSRSRRGSTARCSRSGSARSASSSGGTTSTSSSSSRSSPRSTTCPRAPTTERPRVLERHREKEVIKRRLRALVAPRPADRAFIERNCRELNGKPGEPRTFDLLDDLLEHCSYRLAYWRVAGEEINYRRFFDINALAAIRAGGPRGLRGDAPARHAAGSARGS